MLEAGRQRRLSKLAKPERQALRDRIAVSAPPASTVDGQLRRRKDDAIAAGVEPEEELFGGDDVDEELASLDHELHQPTAAPPRRSSFNQYKPGTRQPAKKPDVVTGELPWWARTKPGEMTKAAEGEQARMSSSKVAKRVSGAVND